MSWALAAVHISAFMDKALADVFFVFIFFISFKILIQKIWRRFKIRLNKLKKTL
jgi:hypothetical protein